MNETTARSPVLILHDGDWIDSNYSTCSLPLVPQWVCDHELRKFYAIPRGHKARIQLVARKHEDRGFTHKLEVEKSSYCYLLKPLSCNLWRPFYLWLLTQEEDGRQHIGVMIQTGGGR